MRKKDGATPIPTDGSDYKASFSESGSSGGVIPQYTNGSKEIATNMQKYNKDYFKNYSSTNTNIKAVAYMLDTTIWTTFSTSSKNYAEMAIGGPSIELLCIAYNKYAGTNYETDAVSSKGYQIRATSSDNFADIFPGAAIVNDTDIIDSPYAVSNLRDKADGYWIASPSNSSVASILYVLGGASVSGYNSIRATQYYQNTYGFRPIVLLDSNYTLEKTKDINGNDAFKIVEQ